MTAFNNEASLAYAVIRAAELMRKCLRRRLREERLHVTVEEFRILGQLGADGALPHAVLAGKSFKDRTTVTRFVDKLLGKGLLKRRESSQDGRVVLVDLTPKGRRLFARAVPIAEEVLSDATRQLSRRECDEMKRLCEHVSESLKSTLSL